MITELKENQVFVFGSNEAGIHGAGAAKTALDNFGAIRGRGFGKFGQSLLFQQKTTISKHFHSQQFKIMLICF